MCKLFGSAFLAMGIHDVIILKWRQNQGLANERKGIIIILGKYWPLLYQGGS